MRKFTLLVFSIFFVFNLSCKQEKRSKTPATENQEVKAESPQMKAVMVIHDEVMPEMSTIGQLVGKLKSKLKTTEANPEYDKAIVDLQTAHTSMMEWMQGFGDKFDADEILNGKELSEEKQKILLKEELKIKEVREQINSSIKAAQNILTE